MQLPPSKLDRDDQNKYPPGPNGMARLCEDRIAELEAAKADCQSSEERRPINKHLRTLRDLLRFAKSRAGYVETPADVGLSGGSWERKLQPPKTQPISGSLALRCARRRRG